MGPETTSTDRVSEDLEQAVTCLRRVMHGIKPDYHGTTENEEEQNPDVICTLQQITGALERCMENNKTLNDVLSGKMKCTTCGSTAVGFLADCHDNSATSTTTTVSHRSSVEPPPRRKASGTTEDEELDEVCSSIGSRSIRSVSSSVNADDDENNQTLLAEKTPEEEEEEHDLVMKTILSTTSTSTAAPVVYNGKKSKKEIKEEEEPVTDPSIDFFIQNALSMVQDVKPESPASEENEDDKAMMSNLLQMLFANGTNPSALLEGGSDGTESTGSSQPSPPNDPSHFDSIAMFESLLAAELNQDASAEAEAKAAAQRKRKSTPMKVPKSENGAGYVCPMEGCNKIFKEKGSVHRHFVTHIGMRFNCDKCKASYTQKHALMLHQKIHANPDAYQCRGCGTNYTTQNGLRLHRQRNPACMEQSNSNNVSMVDFNSSLSDMLSVTKASPTKQMVMAAP
ncbi:hypothetical protein CAEBREN_11039 [Caenorhabditis brenneri]|uniref:C2H2-type domain-containing protein n=1 Tax=Caenorhabditis brenneri TaxID=135651 RepID=G0MIV4_CAEBE|nr:hypothetical protein CAEBREN_11039 [Caenorhabditis brenneri]